MNQIYPTFSQCAIISTALKVLLIPAYKSTDFEVHRNWLAITHSLPIKQWYFEDTSKWTLDYPPFFAYFEFLLSIPASYFHPGMLDVQSLGYNNWQTITYQRSTVLVTELLLYYALHLYIKSAPSALKKSSYAAALSIALSPGLLIIDHIHFQYNGFLYGILVISLVLARKESTYLLSGIFFAALLCFKHIYLYLAPAFFIFLLRSYCLGRRSIFHVRFQNLMKLGVGVTVILASAFGPFLYLGQISQVFQRLFPFSRGLCHAYWAPNFWALYSLADRILILFAPRFGFPLHESAINSVTRGLVGDSSFAILPDITPKITFVLTLMFQLIPLLKLFSRPRDWDVFIGAVTLCGYSSFLFGWHVHEKAILTVIVPFTLIAVKDRRHLAAFQPLAISGHVSLLPLLFTGAELPIKIVYTIIWLTIFLLSFNQLAPASTRPRVFLLDRFSLLYMIAAIPLVLYYSLVHFIIFGPNYEFLPLMLVSSYSALGVLGSWVGFIVVYFTM